ncbi:MAG: zinc-dependent alcohol dehydrogenase family protein [Geminicoccaceae bacterium]
MQALVVESAGGPLMSVHVPSPTLLEGQVLVRIKSSGINPLDIKISQGNAAHAQQPLPAILGMDMAGTVEALGPGVTRFAPGDEVYGMVGGVGGVQGTLAEFAAVDVELLAHKPANLAMREAASLPLAVITAWEGLVDRAQVRAGQSVLVQGGAGGVGQVAVQLAQACGARVFATVAAERKSMVEALGATAIDSGTSVDAYVAAHTGGVGFDIVYDTAGGAALDASFHAVRRGGHVVSCLGWGMHALAPLSFRAATYSGVFTLLPLLTGQGRAHHGWILGESARLVEMGSLRPRLDPRRFTLATANQAHAAVASRIAAGKVVIDVAA